MARRVIPVGQRQLRFWNGPALRPLPPQLPPDLRGCKVHLLGVGGIGMSGIAAHLQHQGCVVSGCDAVASEITEALVQRGMHVSIGHSPEHVSGDAEIVIISAAIRETNPELRHARRRDLIVLKYAQALGWLMKDRQGIAVSGSHGKTTTTSMIAYALSYAGKHPSMLVGGLVPQMGGNSCVDSTGPFVVEACEFDRSFLSLKPMVAVINNIDRDHLDYYSGLPELVEAFGQFAQLVPRGGLVLVNGDDPNAMKAAAGARAEAQSFGEGAQCDWRITEWARQDGKTRFRVQHKGKSQGAFELMVPGLHNVRNALACVAACNFFAANRQEVREALAQFRGARRRFDRVGEAAGVMVLDDYGHHPTEVRVTLDAAKQEYPTRRLWCVFQPHQFSRTRMLMDDFAESFGSADRVIVPDIYAARDSAADRASVHSRDLVQRLCRNGVQAEYGHEFGDTLQRLLAGVRQGDLVMTMGAGPIDRVARRLLTELKKREASDDFVLRS